MGREADCEAAFSWLHGDRFVEGRALLEGDALIFRGPDRVKIALSSIVTSLRFVRPKPARASARK